MTEIICAFLAAAASIICAWMASLDKKREKRSEARAEQRKQESRLALQMMDANSKLTIGVAMALKHGKCNGEVEKGVAAVNRANEEYTKFLEGVALDGIKG